MIFLFYFDGDDGNIWIKPPPVPVELPGSTPMQLGGKPDSYKQGLELSYLSS